MTRKCLVTAVVLGLNAMPLFAAPVLNVTPGGILGGNFVWDVGVAPDLVLSPSGTPIALELGFRLTGAPLLSATNINPAEWVDANPGQEIFGWENLTDVDPGPGINLRPVGLQSNCDAGCTVNGGLDEVFVAYGSVEFTTPGNKPFLRIVTQGPANGGPSLSSSIEWLGVYAVGHGRIAQLVNGLGVNFDVYAGTATQAIPEPATAALVVIALIASASTYPRRRASRTTRG